LVVGDIDVGTDVLIIGAGPAGYTTAIRLGQMGLDVTLAGPDIGGICLHQGCIPVKGILYALNLAADMRNAGAMGITADNVSLNMSKLRAGNDQEIHRLETGIRSMLKASGVQVFEGICSFTSSSSANLVSHGRTQRITFKRAVIATGMHYSVPEGISPDDKRIVFPYAISRMDTVPGSAVVLGGGVAGASMVSVFAKMGTKVSIAYKQSTLISWLDNDLLQAAMNKLAGYGVQVFPGASWTISADHSTVTIRSGDKTQTLNPDLIVLCSPMKPNIEGLSLNNTKVKLKSNGFVAVDDHYRTSDPSIYAMGDVLGGRRNASVAFRDGLTVANILAGKAELPDFQAMPLTLDAGLKITCAGMSEKAAEKAGIDVSVSRSPYSANGGAATTRSPEGFVKVISEKSTGRILGVFIAGIHAGDLLGEAMLAIETGARLEDVALTLHPHPEIVEIFADACARGAGLSANVGKK